MGTHGELMAQLEAIRARASATGSSAVPDHSQLQADLATLAALVDPQRARRLEEARSAMDAGRLAKAAQIMEDVAGSQLTRNSLVAHARERFGQAAAPPTSAPDRLA